MARAWDLVRCGLRVARTWITTGRTRGSAAAHLEPAAGVEARDGAWVALDSDPQLRLGGGHPRLGPGWYMWEISARFEGSTTNAKLYPDFGDGVSEATAVSLPLRNGRIAKRILHLPGAVRGLRVDPVEMAGRFTVEWLRFAPLTEGFAIDRMWKRVRDLHLEHRVFEPETEGADGRAPVPSLDELVSLYGATFDATAMRRSYSDWIRRVERPEWARLDATHEEVIAELRRRPTVSVIVPTFDPDLDHLRACIASVQAQSYPHLQLCIADDASPSPRVRALLEEAAAEDPRIRLTFRERNGHICAASNDALALADGELVALLDHDDTLARHALLCAVMAFDRNPDAVLVYSDEDKLDARGDRVDPHFKSGWNEDLLLAQNYICHLSVMRRDRVREVGAFRPGYEGSQDHDLLLRVTHGLRPQQIVHVPRVLYHWRQTERSTAATAEAKDYAGVAGLRAVASALEAKGIAGVRVEAGIIPHSYRVRWPIPDPPPRATLIVPTRDGLDVLSKCIDSVLTKTDYPNFEVVIVDNGSRERETLAFFEEVSADARVQVLPYDAPFNFSAINNFAVANTVGEIVVLLNNDTEVIDGEWLTEVVSHAVRDDVGCVGAKLHYTDGRIQHGGVILGIGGVAGHAHKYYPPDHPGYFGRLVLVQNVSAVTGACLAVRRSIYEEVGGLDENNLRVAFNDVDFCLKVRDRGYRNVYSPYARLYHHESVSRADDNHPEHVERFHAERDYMCRTWDTHVNHDPYYNPNLTREREDFSLH